MIYYKATQVDGTDFYTGLVDYAGALERGEELPLLTSSTGPYECCTNTVYHASDVPFATLIGCSWPCRLFEVEGEPVAQEDHKFGFRTMKVIKEIPAWQALGPNGREVAALIDRCNTLTRSEAEQLAAAWNAARYAAWNVARYAAWDVARDAARDAAWDAVWYAVRDAVWDAVRDAVWYAVRDAVLALVARDLTSEEHFNTLYGPWHSVMGDL